MKWRIAWFGAGVVALAAAAWLTLASTVLLLRAGLWGHFTWPERAWAWAEYAWFCWSDPSVWPLLQSSAIWAAVGTSVLGSAVAFRAWSLLRRHGAQLLYGKTEWPSREQIHGGGFSLRKSIDG